MKNIVLAALILALPFVSCVSKNQADRITSEKDSLATEVHLKDSLYEQAIHAMIAISANLDSIKVHEKMITEQSFQNEIRKDLEVKINEDISSIARLMEENRLTLANLQAASKQLGQANVKIESLDRLIKTLQAQIAERDDEIAILKKKLEDANVGIEMFAVTVDNMKAERAELIESALTLESELGKAVDSANAAYYIVGEESELIASGIVEKKGFIGRTLKVRSNASPESFTRIDIRNFPKIMVNGKKASLVSVHPESSYQIVRDGDGIVQEIVILDPAAFWQSSRVAVVSYR